MTGSLKEILAKKARLDEPKCSHYFDKDNGQWKCTKCEKTPREIWKK